MWPYRDWVIEAFNRDLPFDQFTIEQLAGDLLLDTPTLDQQVATGFHRNTLINSEGGTKADQFRDEQVKDRVDTTGLVWMGLTVGCARSATRTSSIRSVRPNTIGCMRSSIRPPIETRSLRSSKCRRHGQTKELETLKQKKQELTAQIRGRSGSSEAAGGLGSRDLGTPGSVRSENRISRLDGARPVRQVRQAIDAGKPG